MATLKEVMDEAARECSITPATDWISTTDARYLELRGHMYRTARELLERIDWPEPISAVSTITGPGTVTSNYSTHSLPAAFGRLQRDSFAVYETTNTRRRCVPVSTAGEWTHLDEVGSAGAYRYYRIAGDEEAGFTIDFFRALSATQEVKVHYVAKNWIVTTGSTETDEWANIADTILLPRDLIELGVVWRFRRRSGLAYLDVYGEYEQRLARLSNDYKVRRSLNFGGDSEPAHPMRVPVPDFIPSS
jgi:hypothetical protein